MPPERRQPLVVLVDRILAAKTPTPCFRTGSRWTALSLLLRPDRSRKRNFEGKAIVRNGRIRKGLGFPQEKLVQRTSLTYDGSPSPCSFKSMVLYYYLPLFLTTRFERDSISIFNMRPFNNHTGLLRCTPFLGDKRHQPTGIAL